MVSSVRVGRVRAGIVIAVMREWDGGLRTWEG